ncbi:MAG: PadR family transcriptional regulator [Patulibacter sp.]|nr:PadR family transcriptional regulator [Patulibacter sp.]
MARRPTYGYALMQQLRRWSIDPATVRSSSVYTALSRLEDEELIEVRGPAAAKGTDRQPRMTYGATPAGEERLDAWLATTPGSYDELRLRIALARPADVDHLIAYALSAERECLERLQRYDAPALDPGAPRSWEALCGSILVQLDTIELASRARWLQDARVELEALRGRAERRSGS